MRHPHRRSPRLEAIDRHEVERHRIAMLRALVKISGQLGKLHESAAGRKACDEVVEWLRERLRRDQADVSG